MSRFVNFLLIVYFVELDCKGVKMAKYCANCGRELPDEAEYCPECGQKYVPRQKADGSSGDEFKGPFDDFNNKSSRNPFESSSKSTADTSSRKTSSTSSSIPNSETFPCGKVCIVLFVVFLLFAVISYYASVGDSSGFESDNFEDSLDDSDYDKYKFNNPHENRNIDGRGDIDSNEPYNMSIDKNTYISGQGEAQLIDSNHSYNIESDGFNITDYETYYVNVDDEDWYVLTIFKCEFDTPAQSQVYSTDTDNGDPIIIYGGKGEYTGYGIIMPNSSNDSKYKNLDFLESIFHYKKQ